MMNPEYVFLYFLSALAASVTFLGMNERFEATLFDWIALGSLVLLMAQTLTLALAVKPAL
jgi:hypothetical protein